MDLDLAQDHQSGSAPKKGALLAECHRIFHDTDLRPLLAGLDGNPFQSPLLLSSWFATFSGRGDARECFIVTLREVPGDVIFALPVTRRKVSGITRIELPHSGVIDFTTPLVRVSRVGALPAPEALWALLREAFPAADLVVFRRMGKGGEGFDNPLFALPQVQAGRFVSLRTSPLLPREERHASLSKSFRKKLRHNYKQFLEMPGARFLVASTPEQALRILAWMDSKQSVRIRSKGLEYGLDCPRVQDFYRRLIEGGLDSGQTMIIGMMLGDDIISATFSIFSKTEAVFLRVASDLDQYAALRPGLLTVDAAMDEANKRGILLFDFGMGDYRYKRELGGRINPLNDLIMPLNPKGFCPAQWLRLRQWASVNPYVRKMFGREPLMQV